MVANQWSRRRHQRIRCHTRTRRKSGGRQSLVNQSFGIQMFSARFSNLAVSSDRVAENVETRSNYSSCGMVEYAGVDFPLAQAFTPGLVKRCEFLSPTYGAFANAFRQE